MCNLLLLEPQSSGAQGPGQFKLWSNRMNYLYWFRNFPGSILSKIRFFSIHLLKYFSGFLCMNLYKAICSIANKKPQDPRTVDFEYFEFSIMKCVKCRKHIGNIHTHACLQLHKQKLIQRYASSK